MMIRTDCRHFPGDRPCQYHKANMVTCRSCDRYASRGTSILVIKFDALGDVLRTTAILPALKGAYDCCNVTWITSPQAVDLFTGNDMVDDVLTSPADYLPVLLNREFDVVINPDASRRPCELAAIAHSGNKLGYAADHRGGVMPLNRAAERWLEMGGNDLKKKANRKTYQEILHEICEVDSDGQHIVLGLTDAEKAGRYDLAAEVGIDPDRPVIGMNTGAGPRWDLKKWKLERFIDLTRLVLDTTDAEVLLLGGEGERERNARIRANFGTRVHNPCPSGLREFIRRIDLCNVVVTGDTLALHAALGLEKRVVALFGPTSAAEIDTYGLGAKIVPELECICCYRVDCGRRPSCMDSISVERVAEALIEQLRRVSYASLEQCSVVGEPGRRLEPHG